MQTYCNPFRGNYLETYFSRFKALRAMSCATLLTVSTATLMLPATSLAHHTGGVGRITPSEQPFKGLSLAVRYAIPAPQSEEQAHYLRLLAAAQRDYFWTVDSAPTDAALLLIELVEDLGLVPIGTLLATVSKDTSQFDYAMTRAAFAIINRGHTRAQPTNADDLQGSANESDFSADEQAFISAATDYQLVSFVNNLVPEYEQVALLRGAIKQYQANANQSWPYINPSFRPGFGQRHPQIAAMRNMLIIHGDLSADSNQSPDTATDAYDNVAVAAIKRFQQRHGLAVDGVAGPQTMAALAMPVKELVRRLQLNLQRWFLLPSQEPEHYVYVNIPKYQLQVIEAGEPQLEMKVVVGKKSWQTPTMISEIKEITVNPTWTPTQSIVKKTLLPQYRRNPAALHHRGFHLVRKGNQRQKLRIDSPGLPLLQMLGNYRLVQAPGNRNALGRYRFNIPNSQAIFLHDTPSKKSFHRRVRALSHGCIRLENAKQFAQYILTYDALVRANQRQVERDASDINLQYVSAGNDTSPTPQISTISSGRFANVAADVRQNLAWRVRKNRTQYLPLKQHIPTFIAYQTMWVDDNGRLQILPDIYGIDKRRK